MSAVSTGAAGAATVVDSRAVAGPPTVARFDSESQEWLRSLRGHGAEREDALGRLHALLLGAARFEVARRRPTLPHLRGDDFADIAMQAADDAMMSVLRRLDDFRGESRFTTWAYKFALLEASVAVRRRAWQGRELPVGEARWSTFGAAGPTSHERAETRELLSAIHEATQRVLSDRQREVFTALALNEVPIDVLAERMATTRGALYKSLHDARRKLRDELRRQGLDPSGAGSAD